MKSINKLFGTFAAVCLLLGGAACTDEVEYTGAELQTASQPYFPTNLASQIDLTSDATSFTVQVSRMAAGSELTIDLAKSGDEDALFTVPATATFAADATTADITINYDPSKFELDVYMPLTLTIATEGVDNPYSSNTYSFKAGIPAPYNLIGEVNFRDDIVNSLYGLAPTVYNVELYENSVTPGLYRILNPYKNHPYASAQTYDSSKDYYLTIDARDPNGVYMPDVQPSGLALNSSEGMIYTASMAGYNISNGSSLEAEKAAGTCGTLVDGIITFPYRSLLGGLQNGGNISLYYANSNEAFALSVDPEIGIKDFSVNMSYEGKRTDTYGRNYAIANVELGADVESAQIAIIKGYPSNDDVTKILNGEIPSTTIRSDSEVELACATTGLHSIVAVSYGMSSSETEATAKEVYSISFRYAVGESIPVSYYVGDWIVSGIQYGVDENNKPVTAPVTMLATITDKGNGVLGVSGLAPFTQTYNDEIKLVYETETGNVILAPQQLPDLEGMSILALPSNSSTGYVTQKETLWGEANEYGELSFFNAPENEGDWTDFMIIIATEQGLSPQLMYSLNWQRYVPETGGQRVVTRSTETSLSLSFQSYVKEFMAPLSQTKSSLPIIKCTDGTPEFKGEAVKF